MGAVGVMMLGIRLVSLGFDFEAFWWVVCRSFVLGLLFCLVLFVVICGVGLSGPGVLGL